MSDNSGIIFGNYTVHSLSTDEMFYSKVNSSVRKIYIFRPNHQGLRLGIEPTVAVSLAVSSVYIQDVIPEKYKDILQIIFGLVVNRLIFLK